MEMNCSSSSDGRTALINELTRGMELAKQLRAHLGLELPTETREMLLEQILSSYDKALLILNSSGLVEWLQNVVPSSAMSGSPMSFTKSPRSEDFNDHLESSRDFSKKSRKVKAWRSEQVKVNLENELEGPPDDGYSWRKYGQKDILGAKYPRSYYRCTYRSVQDCWATKQVQRSDEDASIFDITYKGMHTCRNAPRSKSASASPEKQEPKLQTIEYHQESNKILNFRNGLSVDVQNLDTTEMTFPITLTAFDCMNSGNNTLMPSTFNNNDFYHSFDPSFISPVTSEPNYFSASSCKIDNFGGFPQQPESDFADIILANTSGTNSPIVELDFPLDPFHFNPDFPFDNHGFSR
ncbi:hypothetical protein Nepgr_012702 [Nepenthes gracilis]|uniref:WRKY domain-containing protein n=1 Tax=Nepenthes gracilis TaxID=150966 RepID=A0AAD3XNL5_NEPGR|nr:hypothetical protein Nepgr_012702 [Nepenthes gracilis]